jgi:hypothetical protein
MKNYEFSDEEKDLIARLGPMFQERDRIFKETYAIGEGLIHDTLYQLSDIYMKRLPGLLGYGMYEFPSIRKIACPKNLVCHEKK